MHTMVLASRGRNANGEQWTDTVPRMCGFDYAHTLNAQFHMQNAITLIHVVNRATFFCTADDGCYVRRLL
jgi:photosystem II stability/assembly factor-like uncharacterized protein